MVELNGPNVRVFAPTLLDRIGPSFEGELEAYRRGTLIRGRFHKGAHWTVFRAAGLSWLALVAATVVYALMTRSGPLSAGPIVAAAAALVLTIVVAVLRLRESERAAVRGQMRIRDLLSHLDWHEVAKPEQARYDT